VLAVPLRDSASTVAVVVGWWRSSSGAGDGADQPTEGRGQ
jgi:hypothetical protein